MEQPPAARTLRYQSVRSPQGIGTTKPSATGRTTTTVWKILPERRPRCSMTPYSGKNRVPANRSTRELNRRAGPERMSFVDMVVVSPFVSLCQWLAQSGSSFESSELDEIHRRALKELSRCEIQNSVAMLEVCW